MNNSNQYDVCIIGSGAAGLALALSMANQYRVALLSKDDLLAGSSQHAQGGIAAVLEQTDSNLQAHIKDTLIAGDGLCDESAVEFVVNNAKPAIEWLLEQGVQFSLQPNQNTFHLTQEGGHSQRRILHAADKTGAVVVKTLTEQVLSHQNITCFTQHTVIDLLCHNNHCYGVSALDQKNNAIINISSHFTVLATGGASAVYQHTTNPDQATGDGIAMAWRAGCRIANMEFNQFHPTSLHHNSDTSFLITEAMRGEGAVLLLPNGKRFMPKYDQRAELAPRDIVARAIDDVMKKNNLSHVLLDITHKNADDIRTLFPTIYSYCLQHHIDITKGPIPVVPSAHYTCGGVVTDLNGKTDIEHLYAIGETACTGLHGANRMASNSLLECLVFAMSAARSIQELLPQVNSPIPEILNATATSNPPTTNFSSITIELRKLMWQHAGIVRTNEGLLLALDKIEHIKQQANIHNNFLNTEFIELNNLIAVSELIIKSALSRHESRGLHFNTDYPEKMSTVENTVLQTDKKNYSLAQI